MSTEILAASETFVSSIVVACTALVLSAVISFFTYVVKRLSSHDTALAVILQQVNPPGGKPLRDMLLELQLEQVRMSATLVSNVSAHSPAGPLVP